MSPRSDHPDDETLATWVISANAEDNISANAEGQEIRRHVDQCTVCSQRVNDLRKNIEQESLETVAFENACGAARDARLTIKAGCCCRGH